MDTHKLAISWHRLLHQLIGHDFFNIRTVHRTNNWVSDLTYRWRHLKVVRNLTVEVIDNSELNLRSLALLANLRLINLMLPRLDWKFFHNATQSKVGVQILRDPSFKGFGCNLFPRSFSELSLLLQVIFLWWCRVWWWRIVSEDHCIRGFAMDRSRRILFRLIIDKIFFKNIGVQQPHLLPIKRFRLHNSGSCWLLLGN